jgi:hypothetical protein
MIKVSKIGTLNDPYEFMPYKRYNTQKRRDFNKVFRSVEKKWGILCFSQTWEEQLLWAHYADKHKGIALGFEIPEDKLIEVIYVCNEIRTKIELTNDSKENEQKFLDLAKIKFQEWKYEKEYRLLIPLAKCEQKEKYFFYPFGNNLKISRIILGCRFDNEENEETISELAKQLDVVIIPTRSAWQDYRIHQCGTKTEKYRKLLG